MTKNAEAVGQISKEGKIISNHEKEEYFHEEWDLSQALKNGYV